MKLTGLFRTVKSIYLSLNDLIVPLRNQKMLPVSILLIVIFLIGLIFSFLNYASVLSPFVYPLF